MTLKMRHALEALRRHRALKRDERDPDGAYSSESWLEDRPPFVHWRTADALAAAGYVWIDAFPPEGGDIWLTDKGLA